MRKFILYILFFISILSCSKKVDIPLSNSSFLNKDAALNSEVVRKSLCDRLYFSWHSIFDSYSSNNFSLQFGLYSDEFELLIQNINYTDIYSNEFRLNSIGYYNVTDYFSSFYSIINTSNIIIDIYASIPESNRVVNDQLMVGEAYLFKAMSYHYLKMIYGGVPLFYNSVDFNENFESGRSSVEEVNKYILENTRNALFYLSDQKLKFDFNESLNVSFRLNKDAAYMFLSDFYLDIKFFDSAIYYAGLIVDKYPLETNLNETFTINSSESIWTLQNFGNNYSVASANIFNLSTQGVTNLSPVGLSRFLIDLINIDDRRYGEWYLNRVINQQDVYYSKKYNTLSPVINNIDPYVMFRSSKAYYNIAEAYWYLGDIDNCFSYFSDVWSKNHNSTLLKDDFSIELLINDRFLEFSTEAADRWFTLKRNNLLDIVMPELIDFKSDGLTQWQPYKALWPLGMSIIQNSPFVTQTSGYFHPFLN